MPVCSPHTRDSAKSAVRARRPEPWAAVANCSGHRLKTPLTSSNRPAAPAKDPIASRPVSVPYAPAPVPPQYRADQKPPELPRKTGGSQGVPVCPVLWARWGGEKAWAGLAGYPGYTAIGKRSGGNKWRICGGCVWSAKLFGAWWYRLHCVSAFV